MSGIITSDHLNRPAIIYIRQSSQFQVDNNTTSQEVQRNLKKRALDLGWQEHQIFIIDEDLGCSASVESKRSGYDNLISKICQGAGAIFFLYSSRLSRNDEEWCRAVNICAIYNVLLIDRNNIYDPSKPTDCMSLGIQSVFSQYEVRQMQERAKEALALLASQGKAFFKLPPAYVATEDGRIEKNPDKRIQQSIMDVFSYFDKFGSISQVHKYYFKNQIEHPVLIGNKIIYRAPSMGVINKILTDDIYTGTYRHPKTETRTRVENGKQLKSRGHRVYDEKKQTIFLKHFEPYISKEKYEQNQKIIANNRMLVSNNSTGAAREGQSLLAGLMRCGHCSRNFKVDYNKSKDKTKSLTYHYYYCRRRHYFSDSKNEERIGFNGQKLDDIVAEEIMKVVQPYAIKAAIAAEEKYNKLNDEKLSYLSNSIEQAQYEADRIERQYNKIEPENRLVADKLEQRWQKALEKLDDLQSKHSQAKSEQKQLTTKQKEQLFNLPNELKRVWNDPKCDNREKTRLIRLLINEIWITRLTPVKYKAVIHWNDNIHTTYEFTRRAKSRKSNAQKQKVVLTADVVRQLARTCDDEQIVRILNRANYCPEESATDLSWTKSRIKQIRDENNIAEFSQQRLDRLGIVTLKQTSDILNVSFETVTKLIKAELIKAKQVIKYAPWEIKKDDLSKPKVLHYIKSIQRGKSKAANKNQTELI